MYKYTHEVRGYETDMFAQVPPSMLVRMAVEAATLASVEEGVSREFIFPALGAVWMLSRLELRQSRVIRDGERLRIDATYIEATSVSYLRRLIFSVDGEPAAVCDMESIVVDFDKRRILRPEVLLPLIKEHVRDDNEEQPVPVHRLRVSGELEHIRDIEVRRYDCDLNGHLTAPRYADYVCECSGYWDETPKMCEYLHIEYSGESRPGERLNIFASGESKKMLMKAVREDGKAAFSAEIRTADMQ